ncbi:AraC family transcriptional regulator [Rhodoferax fermentans]|nr:AraC family transcriptional regulator [Rhodoferax fermentans]
MGVCQKIPSPLFRCLSWPGVVIGGFQGTCRLQGRDHLVQEQRQRTQAATGQGDEPVDGIGRSPSQDLLDRVSGCPNHLPMRGRHHLGQGQQVLQRGPVAGDAAQQQLGMGAAAHRLCWRRKVFGAKATVIRQAIKRDTQDGSQLGQALGPIQVCVCLIEPQQLAQELGMSVSTLQRLFKAAYGMSVMAFQRSERLNAARALLMEGRLTVGEAGYRAGYSTVSNFSSAFQRNFGYPPSACMRR